MKVTNEMLDRFGIKLGGGVNEKEFSDVLVTEVFPMKVYHYIRKYYRLTEEELKLYFRHCGIFHSENVWDSCSVLNSNNLFNSYNVEDSNFIRDSEDVKISADIYNSTSVNNSADVAHSSGINRSLIVVESQNVEFSRRVARSHNIKWSEVILNSSNLDGCNYVYMSQDLIDCSFCGFMKNSRHCMFCVGLEDKEYYIFNKPVSQKEYEIVKDKLVALLEEEKSTMIRVNDSKHTAEERFELNRRLDSIVNGLSKEFFGWVGTLPNYSDNIFLDLFFRDREEI